MMIIFLPTVGKYRIALQITADESLTITEPFQILGVQPVGANYIHVHDKNINTIEKLIGKKMAVLDWDKIETIMAQKIGMQGL